MPDINTLAERMERVQHQVDTLSGMVDRLIRLEERQGQNRETFDRLFTALEQVRAQSAAHFDVLRKDAVESGRSMETRIAALERNQPINALMQRIMWAVFMIAGTVLLGGAIKIVFHL